jgi:predicted nucleic acid-binding protein
MTSRQTSGRSAPRQVLRRILGRPDRRLLGQLEPVPITEPVARVHAEVWAQLTAKGAVIGSHDLWIAASVLAQGFGVVTRNDRDFGRVPGLRVLALEH